MPLNVDETFALALRRHQSGRLAEAERGYRDILQVQPEHTDSLHLLGVLALQTGNPEPALELIQRAVTLRPDGAIYRNNLGQVLERLGRIEDAARAYEAAIELDPRDAEPVNNLGRILERQEHLADAETHYRKAIELNSRYAEPQLNLGNLFKDRGELDGAIAAYRRAIALRPDLSVLHSNLLLTLHYHPDYSPADIAREHRRWAERHARPLMPSEGHGLAAGAVPGPAERQPGPLTPSEGRSLASGAVPGRAEHHATPLTPKRPENLPATTRHVAPPATRQSLHDNTPDPERRLRIGYVSPDFREHPVARFILPLLERHDRQQFEVFAYHDIARRDGLTQRVRKHADRWRDIADLGDGQVADRIRSDRIDILVDLAAHSGRNRLLVFARKPAPVQVTYLAYCSTTGVDAIDYRLTDRFLDPPEESTSHYSEHSVRLPGCYWCYSRPLPPGERPPPNSRPSPGERPPPDERPPPNGRPPPGGRQPSSVRRPGPPTFGCLNNFAKVTDPTLELWMKLLRRAPQARLLLYARSEPHRERVRRFMQQADMAESRVAFVGRQPYENYLDTWREIDVALDPIPFGGGTTTCDALWMGTPVVTLAGRTAVSRGGSSILNNIGLGELVSRSEDRYLELAARLIGDTERLAVLRRELRDRLEGSPVMDAARFTRGVEDAFREMWRQWCRANQYQNTVP